ncbi:GNAT family N-acetyltransferase [Saccharospirillum sp. MSK14-1]|uniref:GNAT family N-acetyltransferase n=1 Tax=Saccharospirillum sp. MSK14-1 TaxID=1897632 RepID=UPI000D339859|nr:GNAT family N-acetyltransferase [Saccharospirillum sp. MSK14-1]PTY36469.1 GNAT family N-acetyltransferase [Saccharospirillum sp. MSK14-1]
MNRKPALFIKTVPWQQTLAIRHQVLWPDKPEAFCRVEGDDTAWHLGAFIDDQLVSVASVYFEVNVARLRKFATLAAYQKQGIGSAVLQRILDELPSRSVNYFWCDARESALGFYQRFGMKPEGERFYKGDIAYVRMGLRC